MRIIFLGTPDFAVASLRALCDAGHDVACVVTQPDRPSGRRRRLVASPVKEFALARGLEVRQSDDVNAPPFLAALGELAPELILVAAFGQKLGRALLELPRHGCINVHASLLPRHRGAAPIAHAILAGDAETGVSIMRMAEAMDTGDVLIQRAIPIDPRDTTGALGARLAELGAHLLLEAVGQTAAGWSETIRQDDSKATRAPSLRKSDGAVDWARPAAYLARFVRAMTPWPGAFTFWSPPGKRPIRLLLHDVEAVLSSAPSVPPGAVVAAESGRITVQTGDGLLHLLTLQPAGKRPMSATAFLRGHPLAPGSRLGQAAGGG